jgi:hypothetical protein
MFAIWAPAWEHSQLTETKGVGAVYLWRSAKESLHNGKLLSHYLGKVFSSLGLAIRLRISAWASAGGKAAVNLDQICLNFWPG